MRTLLLGAVLLVCGIGVAEGAPDLYPAAVRAERVVMQLEPGKVTKAQSEYHFTQAETVGIVAYVKGRALWDVDANGRRIDLAGRGAYVVADVPLRGPVTLKAVAMRKMRLVVYMEWTA